MQRQPAETDTPMQTLALTRAAAETMLPANPSAAPPPAPPAHRQPERRDVHSRGGGGGGGGDVARQPDAAALDEVEHLCGEADKLQQVRGRPCLRCLHPGRGRCSGLLAGARLDRAHPQR